MLYRCCCVSCTAISLGKIRTSSDHSIAGSLALVLVPFIGKEVNGSRRWIDLGFFTIQVSETVKLFIIVYLAGYLVRRGHLVQTTFGGFARPLLLICVACGLLLLGTGLWCCSGHCINCYVDAVCSRRQVRQFVALIGVLGALATFLIMLSPYRLRRFVSFMDPFADAFDSGYQLSNSLIAIVVVE